MCASGTVDNGIEIVKNNRSLRYLFVIDASYSMRPFKNVVRQSMYNLVYSGLQGRMSEGDRFSVWLYNKSVFTNEFGNPDWRRDDDRVLASKVNVFLKSTDFENSSDIQGMMSALKPLIKSAHELTVLIYTDGQDEILGTPFDNKINELYMKHRQELKRNGLPFITLLQVLDGEIVDASVNAALRPLVVPDLPEPREERGKTGVEEGGTEKTKAAVDERNPEKALKTEAADTDKAVASEVEQAQNDPSSSEQAVSTSPPPVVEKVSPEPAVEIESQGGTASESQDKDGERAPVGNTEDIHKKEGATGDVSVAPGEIAQTNSVQTTPKQESQPPDAVEEQSDAPSRDIDVTREQNQESDQPKAREPNDASVESNDDTSVIRKEGLPQAHGRTNSAEPDAKSVTYTFETSSVVAGQNTETVDESVEETDDPESVGVNTVFLAIGGAGGALAVLLLIVLFKRKNSGIPEQSLISQSMEHKK